MGLLPRGLALCALLAVVCLAMPAFAAPQISIVERGGGVFVLQGNNFADVSGLDVLVKYDPKTLGNPRVAEGSLVSGAMLVTNLTTPGVVRIALIRLAPISGTGSVATLTFDQKGPTPGRILEVIPTIINSSGGTVEPQQTKLPEQTPTDIKTSDGKGGTTTTTQPPASGVTITPVKEQPIVTGGTVTLPTDLSQPAEKAAQESRPSSAEPPPAAETPTTAATPETAPEEPRKEPVETAGSKETVYPGLLDSFRDFTGEKTPQALEALFTDYAIPGVKQEPAIVLSDGKNKVTIRVDLPASEKDAPNFALRNAKLISLKMTDGGTWVIEAQPKEKASDVALSVLQGTRLTEIPLVAAPPVAVDLDKSGKVDDKDAQLFLRETGTPKAPKFDLNGDGKRDYLDEYIFFANSLAVQKKAKDGAKPAEKGPAKPGEKPKTDAKPEGAAKPAPEGVSKGVPKP